MSLQTFLMSLLLLTGYFLRFRMRWCHFILSSSLLFVMSFDFKRWFSHLLRMPRTRGFGVQSPFAYRFVRKVLKGNDLKVDRLLYDSAYNSNLPLRICRLLSRLAYYIKSDVCYVSRSLPFDAISAFVMAGHHSTVCTRVVSDDIAFTFSVVSVSDGYLNAVVHAMSSCGMMVVLGIRSCRDAREAWKELMDDYRTGVSFDLYDVGVLFFDTKMYKQSYRCNY